MFQSFSTVGQNVEDILTGYKLVYNVTTIKYKCLISCEIYIFISITNVGIR